MIHDIILTRPYDRVSMSVCMFEFVSVPSLVSVPDPLSGTETIPSQARNDIYILVSQDCTNIVLPIFMLLLTNS